jgi:DNA ligase D-like protein (predicted ligase)/DNA ligase D-like protein (predicted polymerase)/DNA ligase D-like protein (predicted 3'-phosphoesterase)
VPPKSQPRRKSAFTVELPRALEVERQGREAWFTEVDGRELRLSNLDKVFWPDEGYTKGDLIAYYLNVAELILPHLRDRPLTMKRMPDGINGPFFYEKNAPASVPEWMPRCPVPSEDAKGGLINYLIVDSTAGILFVANLGCIEFHPLHSRCGTVEQPDYLFFDLDPFPPITFDDVLAVAMHVNVALEALGLVGYPKTSGATGMQIYVPIEPGYGYDQIRELVGRIGRMINKVDPARTTMEWQVKKRSGKVFIDHNMNRLGANIAAVYSMRPEPMATVSTPVTWDEVERGLRPQDFTIETVWDRFARLGDLFEPIRTQPQDIRPALEALGLPTEPEFAKPKRSRPTAPSADDRRTRAADASERTSEDVIAASKDPNLADYLAKRTFGPEGTPEPPPTAPKQPRGNSFVIQKHRATRLHYDLRLERHGAMPSWAVPRGLPIARNDRRLAVQTEDHPIEYASFHGTIPEGHYGAGEVRIFDNGTYDLVEWDDKKVSFVLHGRRYPGLEYHLVKTRTDWLIFLASHQEVSLIASPGINVPMLAEAGGKPFDGKDWWFEPKLDGIRALATMSTGETRLQTRNGRDVSDAYPELHMIHELVDQVNAVIDGEIVAFEPDGRPSFEMLQQRMNLKNEREIKRMSKQIPVTLVAFDILWLDGEELTGAPLEERREALESIAERDDRLQVVTHVRGEGKAFVEAARKLRLEGVVAKKMGSRYQPGRRTADWRKIKLTNTQDCVILGWTRGEGGRGQTFGALLVGAIVDGVLKWIGQVGTGFTQKMQETLMEQLKPLERKTPPIDDRELKAVKGATWVEPKLVCEVEYLELTKSTTKMRAPSFKGLRPDKAPDEAVLERPVS